MTSPSHRGDLLNTVGERIRRNVEMLPKRRAPPAKCRRRVVVVLDQKKPIAFGS